MTKSLKMGYEGEGPMLGRRTVYASYPEVSVVEVVNVAVNNRIDSIYFVIDSNHQQFVQELMGVSKNVIKVVTIDFLVKDYRYFVRLANVIRFIRCDAETSLDDIPLQSALIDQTYIKMVCATAFDFPMYVDKANEIAMHDHTVLLMPDFWVDCPKHLGEIMMKAFDKLHPGVRLMPPVHHVLRMP